ncbi:MAG TPA: hypothetical protein VLE43_21100 [Candidatus Saccharimonadia bacterium]|nr:hypothetical protein [Candidatus Saccharimonadia bacterium]
MIPFRQFFANPLQKNSISEDALRIFAYDHLQRLTAANGGEEFNARLTDTVWAFTSFGGVVTGMELNRSLQLAATAEMYLRWNAFREWMSHEGESRITSKAGRESVMYARFFPEGVDELHRATLHGAGAILDRMLGMVTGSHAMNGQLLGAEFVSRVASYRGEFFTARNAQLALRGELLGMVVDSSKARTGLETQLFGNMLALLQRHRRAPGEAAQYFNPMLLEYDALPKATQRVPVLAAASA